MLCCSVSGRFVDLCDIYEYIYTGRERGRGREREREGERERERCDRFVDLCFHVYTSVHIRTHTHTHTERERCDVHGVQTGSWTCISCVWMCMFTLCMCVRVHMYISVHTYTCVTCMVARVWVWDWIGIAALRRGSSPPKTSHFGHQRAAGDAML
jgi:hypothetical protein